MCKKKGKSCTNDVFIQNQSFHMDLSFVSGPTNLNQVLEEGAKVEKNIQKSRERYIGFLTIIDKALRKLWAHPIKNKEPPVEYID